MSTDKASHTPGPWVSADYGDYGDYFGECRVILGEGGNIRTAVVLGFDNKENQANARLIAAAPELLVALRTLVDCVEYSNVRQDADAWIEARAAIAKAA